MKRHFANAVIVVSLALLCVLQMAPAARCDDSTTQRGGDRMILDVKSFDKGVLVLRVELSFDTPKRIYSWRGHLYPALDYFVIATAVAEDGSPLDVARFEKPLPLFPHPLDVVTKAVYTHPEPLKLLITREGAPYDGCLRLTLKYDTYDYEHKLEYLDLVRSESTLERVCSGEGVPKYR